MLFFPGYHWGKKDFFLFLFFLTSDNFVLIFPVSVLDFWNTFKDHFWNKHTTVLSEACQPLMSSCWLSKNRPLHFHGVFRKAFVVSGIFFVYVFSLPQIRTWLLASPWLACWFPLWPAFLSGAGRVTQPLQVLIFFRWLQILKNSMVIVVGVLPRGFGLYNWIPGSFSCFLSLEFALTFEARNGLITSEHGTKTYTFQEAQRSL